jgi:hypothetical protein
MKNTIAIVLLFIISFSSLQAQIYTPSGTIQGTSTNNYVGIGTNAPSHKLEIDGSHSDSRFLLHSLGGSSEDRQADLMLWASEPGWTYSGTGIGNNVKNEYNATNGLAINRLNLARGGSYIRLLDNQMVFNIVSSSGIDKSVFNINNNGLFTVSESALIRSSLNIGKQEAPANSAGEIIRLSLQPYGHTGGPWNFKARDISGVAFLDVMYGTGNAMTINSNLNVGIGTTSPDEKLTVKGKIHAQEVRVDMAGSLVPDYVFAKEYRLKTLPEVEAYIKENKHLSEIPSAYDIEKNGLLLAEMNMSLLKKVEELTLYAIEQNKEIEVLKNENSKILKMHQDCETLQSLTEGFKLLQAEIIKLKAKNNN